MLHRLEGQDGRVDLVLCAENAWDFTDIGQLL
jgi:hypothetical protein